MISSRTNSEQICSLRIEKSDLSVKSKRLPLPNCDEKLFKGHSV